MSIRFWEHRRGQSGRCEDDAPCLATSQRPNFAFRSSETELLDSAEFCGRDLVLALRDIARFNRWLGGNRSLIRGVQRALTWLPHHALTVVDLGCGSGDGLRALARFSAGHGLGFKLIGLDANPHVIDTARRESVDFPEIEFLVGDAFGPDLETLQPDIVVANQFFHHLTSAALADHVPKLLKCTRALVVTDLHRHRVAHAGFGILAKMFRASPVALHDGQVSIRRGFTRAELTKLIAPLTLTHRSLVWAFPFRFEVVLVP